MNPALRFPEDIRAFCAARFRGRHREWLAGGGAWPLEIPTGVPGEAFAQSDSAAVRDWVEAWREWLGPGRLEWCERRWRTLGPQTLPERLVLDDPCQIAAWIGEDARWDRALARYRRAVARWPLLASRLPRYFDSLADSPDADIARLESVLGWIEENPRSGLYPRQVPLAGMDTKWLEPRMPMLADLIAALRQEPAGQRGFHDLCGLRKPSARVRFRILDDALRRLTGGLGDVTAPLADVAALALPASRVYLVENIESGLCFGDVPGSVIFLGLGYAVSSLGQIPWVAAAPCIYWGDLDTHGFAMLHHARAALPGLASVLMDQETLLKNRDLWVQEREPCTLDLPLLTPAERHVYLGLRDQRWGVNVRLEQERIAWDEAWRALCPGC